MQPRLVSLRDFGKCCDVVERARNPSIPSAPLLNHRRHDTGRFLRIADVTLEYAVTQASRNKERVPWNKGLEVGPMAPLSKVDVGRIRKAIQARGTAGYRDLALFNTALDSMISAPDILNLVVSDVRHGNGRMRSVVLLSLVGNRQRRGPGAQHQFALSQAAALALQAWMENSGLRTEDFIFRGRGEGGALTARQMSRLMKEWTEAAGLDSTRYGLESLRRTKPTLIFEGTGNIETVRVLLGHAKIESTVRFLSLSKATTPSQALAVARQYEL